MTQYYSSQLPSSFELVMIFHRQEILQAERDLSSKSQLNSEERMLHSESDVEEIIITEEEIKKLFECSEEEMDKIGW